MSRGKGGQWWAKIRHIFYCLHRGIQKCPGVRKGRGGWDRNQQFQNWQISRYFARIHCEDRQATFPLKAGISALRKLVRQFHFNYTKRKKGQPASLEWPFVIFLPLATGLTDWNNNLLRTKKGQQHGLVSQIYATDLRSWSPLLYFQETWSAGSQFEDISRRKYSEQSSPCFVPHSHKACAQDGPGCLWRSPKCHLNENNGDQRCVNFVCWWSTLG